MDKETADKIATLHSHWFSSNISGDWQPLYGGSNFIQDLSNLLKELGYCKPPDRAGLEGRIGDIVILIASKQAAWCSKALTTRQEPLGRSDFIDFINKLLVLYPELPPKPQVLSDEKTRATPSYWKCP